MMRSLFAGVAGLKTHQVKMDVIGNNIANVNTVGYKSQSINFSELMYQTTQAASGPNPETGRAGQNAKQIGLGVQSAAITTNIELQGSSQNTGNAFDLRISGSNFFVVNGGDGNKFTRDGSFYVDAAGNLAMSSNGYNVMGWQVDKNGDIVQDNVSKLQILSEANMTSEPQLTSRATMNGIVDKNDPQVLGDGKIINLQIYDNLGYSYTARFRMVGTDNEGQYSLELDKLLDSNNEDVSDKYEANIFTGSAVDKTSNVPVAKAKSFGLADGWNLAANGSITKQNADGSTTTRTPNDTGTETVDGKEVNKTDLYAQAWGFDDWNDLKSRMVSTQGTGTEANNVSLATILTGGGGYTKPDGTAANVIDVDKRTINVDGYFKDGGKALLVNYDQISGALKGVNGTSKTFNLGIQPTTKGADNPFSMASAQGDDQGKPGIRVDMSNTSNVNNERKSTISGVSGDDQGFGTGWAVGAMTGVSIQADGKIFGAYDNGQTKLLGQIATAQFSNPAGLEKTSDNLYQATLNSGKFDGIGVDISSDGGSMSTGVLEMSNVDLSSEFTSLITTQRGFQANSRIITVSDTLLEELVNLKR
ncbi:MAG: flagellar hook-basal body complex protein [Lachnospiraceae bacterium]|nr:flagellar hook-basal body complex protein [Lachnospiraceae bacterium]